MAEFHILLVEDDPISAKLACNILTALDVEVEVTTVTKGEDAVALFEADNNFDLILMDLFLPGISGFVAWEKIQASEIYNKRKIPAIALTSNTLMEPKPQFLKSTGFAEYYMKPVRKETFATIVTQHLAKSAQIRRLNWY